ncbi:hypothetical protein EJ08DRAFT_605829 [Tothia fuscella]|uniref:Formin GTPase-binding domain-containing protein n=1 Tax=Tothia fuscella TaxID=1048955 RepID=A0A9P4NZF1_9PEZI|nr:hypothetical protein EJ08DRAFT_605829 [Tothia fuscella]
MDSTQTTEQPQHRRNKSASVLKSIMLSSKAHKPAPPNDMSQAAHITANHNPFYNTNTPMLPPNHPHAGLRVLEEKQHTNNTPPSPRRTKTEEDRPKMHKKTLSTISLRSMGKEKNEKSSAKDKAKPRSKSTRPTSKDKEPPTTPKKSKSTTGLAAVFSRPKSARKEGPEASIPKDKENTTPPSSAIIAPAHTPIWAQFSSDAARETRSSTQVPLNDKQAILEEMDRYMPKKHAQRNFYGMEQPLMTRPARPKSDIFGANSSAISIYETLSRNKSQERPEIRRGNSEEQARNSAPVNVVKSSVAQEVPASEQQKRAVTRRGRVMDTVNIFNNKAKTADPTSNLDPKQVDAELEAVLESTNTAEDVRKKMRGMDLTTKLGMIRGSRIAANNSTGSSNHSSSSKHGVKDLAPVLSHEEAQEVEANVPIETPQTPNTKRSRPRSKTFTFSRGDKGSTSPKKQKSETPLEEKRSSRIGNLPNTSTTSLGKSTSSSFLGKLQKAATPDEYVTYLRKVRDPKDVEVGKLQKLRQLLRNEAVSWVVNFIDQGGMAEIAELLHRIMEIEWREDHEDALLHETLNCLKALCTTDMALQKLCEIEATLFPALLAMLFDPEHKGPSEFTTREIVMKILLAHLQAALCMPDILASRAETLLSYLTDPAPSDEKAPIPFILSMRQSRPYKIWCKEVVDVTKEVFWIFLHHLNMIAYPDTPTADSTTSTSPPPLTNSPIKSAPQPRTLDATIYAKEFFPRTRPPVPAAPYVGGVEWDATNYLASHLDLLNGILASLPTRSRRNALRSELRASGFEKCMGAQLRTCKEKFYGSVHDGLRTWVAAACADAWDVRDVRMGPKIEEGARSPRKGSPVKKSDKPPVLEAPPKMSLRLGGKIGEGGVVDDWL